MWNNQYNGVLVAFINHIGMSQCVDYALSYKNKDLCKTRKHYWTDFIIHPNKTYIAHCEILDEKYGLSADMNEQVEYPCLKCPFNCYIKKN